MFTRLSRIGRNEEGFTLIELLVVVAIIALLTAFAVPKLFDAITSAKDVRGLGDMDTIPGALDRYYFDNNKFPVVAGAGTEAAVKALLVPSYLKNSTRWANGYNRGYIYFSNAAGDFYVIVDPKNNALAANITVTCNTTKTNSGAVGAGLVVVPVGVGATDITAADVRTGTCTASGGASFVTN